MTTIDTKTLLPVETTDDLLNQIFSAVTLTPVNYEPHETSHVAVVPVGINSKVMAHSDEDAALRQLDDVLQYQSSRHTSLYNDEPSEFEDDDALPIGDIPDAEPQTQQHSVHKLVIEIQDDSQTARLDGPKEVQPSDEPRSRSWTYDSSVSVGESRVGGFDLVDESNNVKYESISLHHDEVAYFRLVENSVSPDNCTSVPHPPPLPETVEVPLTKTQIQIQENAIIEQVKKARADPVQNDTVSQNKPKSVTIDKISEKTDHSKNIKESDLHKGEKIAVSSKKIITSSSHVKNNSSKYRPEHAKWLTNFQNDYHHPIDMYEENVPVSPVLIKQLQSAKHVDTAEFRFFVPQHERVKLSANIEKITFGGHQEPTKDDKSVLLFGPISSGKTTFVYTLINFLYDVQKEHDIRFSIDLLEMNRSTNGIYVYVFNNTIFPYSITIVDTPGVPDKKGYTKTSSLIRQWFELELQSYGLLRIDVISIVVRYDEGELGWPLINELAAVKRLLKDELRTNVMPITTFGEILPQPPALRSIVFANIPFVAYYKVNNIGYMPKPASLKSLRHNLGFKHSVSELERYFEDLSDLVSPLLAVRAEH